MALINILVFRTALVGVLLLRAAKADEITATMLKFHARGFSCNSIEDEKGVLSALCMRATYCFTSWVLIWLASDCPGHYFPVHLNDVSLLWLETCSKCACEHLAHHDSYIHRKGQNWTHLLWNCSLKRGIYIKSSLPLQTFFSWSYSLFQRNTFLYTSHTWMNLCLTCDDIDVRFADDVRYCVLMHWVCLLQTACSSALVDYLGPTAFVLIRA